MDQFVQNSVSQPITPRNSTLAIVSFINGLISLVCCVLWPILGLPAIICGIIALVKISNSNGMLKGKGYAITGIVIPAVMIVLFPIIGMFAAIMFPALSQARGAATKLVCANNERQIALALISYCEESSGMLPEENWMEVMQEKGLIQGENVFICVDARKQAAYYVLNKYIKNLNEVKNPARTVLIFEGDSSNADGRGGNDNILFPHKQGTTEGCNVGFVDGHTEFVTIENKDTLFWFPDQQ
jgi:prepilin-type processing-associated H-X9-DG protein